MKHRRHIIQLLLITALVFVNSLFNGFVGDDGFLLLNNDFYTSWSNIKDLFSSAYTTQSEGAIGVQDVKQYSSGSVAYRPVLSLTFFFDYWIWKLNAFGYHLTNLIWHMANVVAVYALIFLLRKDSFLALVSAIIFSIHPFKSEAVCSIGYRADLVSTFFLLVSFIFYVSYQAKRSESNKSALFGSYLSFGLAIFAKESVIVYSAVLILYDRIFKRTKWRDLFKNSAVGRYSGFWIISLFYLYVYLYVFPNQTIGGAGLMGGSLKTHLHTAVYIVAEYLQGFFAPFSVGVLPPVYVPPVETVLGWQTIVMLSILAVSAIVFWVMVRSNSKAGFFLGWFVICMIPVSNLVPLVNPMAYRFLYLPSIGVSVLLAGMIIQSGGWLNRKTQANHFVNIFLVGFIAFCAARTIPLNSFWKNDLVMSYRMYESRPNYPTSQLFMAITYAQLNQNPEARELALKAIDNGLQDPRAYYILGKGEDLADAKYYLIKGLNKYPSYGMLYTAMGRVLLLQNDLEVVESYLKKGIELAPSYRGYCYLVQYYLMIGNESAAREVLESAKSNLADPKFHSFIENLIINRNELMLPQDIGI